MRSCLSTSRLLLLLLPLLVLPLRLLLLVLRLLMLVLLLPLLRLRLVLRLLLLLLRLLLLLLVALGMLGWSRLTVVFLCLLFSFSSHSLAFFSQMLDESHFLVKPSVITNII